MSELWIDELDDNISDEVHGNDDGIVPDFAYEDGGKSSVLVSSRKKQRHENMGNGTNHLKSNTFIKREGDMLGRNQWPEKILRSCKDVTLEDTKISDHGSNGGRVDVAENFCTVDPMLCDSSDATHDGVYNYSLNNIENNLTFLDDGNKESNDLLYGWGDIGNFEDVDNMLRICDSTFGLDCLNNEDDMCWFSSAQPNEDTETAMIDDIKPDVLLGNQSTPMLQVEDFLNNRESNNTVEDEYGYTVGGRSAQGKSLGNESDTSSQKKDTLMLDVEANLEKMQTDHLHHLDGKSDGSSENSFTLQHSGISSEIMDTNQCFHLSGFRQPGLSNSHYNFEEPSIQVSVCESESGIKSENKPNPSSTSNESYTSSQAQSIESLQGPTVYSQCKKGFKTRVNLQTGKDMPPFITRKSSKTNPTVFAYAAPIQKIELENGHRKAAAELETSNRQESSCVSSVVDDISLEATSLRQLQQVVEQLDVRTKLCIRDSLYRLAKSAEQRHSFMNPNGGNRKEKGAGSRLVTGETDKYGFMDMETDTNPIDRSIAHLLFHRPSDSSLSSDNNILSHKSHPMISQPNISPSLRIEKQEETPELKAETEVAISDNK